MTLAQNHPLRLNGSSAILALLLLTSIVSACGGTKKVTNKNNGLSTVTTSGAGNAPIVDKPIEKPIEKPHSGYAPIKRDTIVWYDTIFTDREKLVVRNKEYQGVRVAKDTISRILIKKTMDKSPKSSYNMVVMLPFMTHLFDPSKGGNVPEQCRIAVNFYEGMKMAIQDLRSEGLVLNIRVVDENVGGSVVDSLLNTEEVLNADVIFGPVLHNSVNKVSEFCLREGKLHISPIDPKEITHPNENFLQFNPTVKGHSEATLKHCFDRFRTRTNVIIVSRDEPNELEVVRYLESIYPLYDRMGGTIHTYTIPEGSMFSCETFNQYTSYSDSNVVIVPSWANETFVGETVKAIRSCGKRTYIFGMPKWADMKKIYSSFGPNVYISDEVDVNVEQEEIKKFRRRYFDSFRSVPGEFNYKGYDIMLYLGRMLKRNGLGLVDKIGDSEQTYYHTSFYFKPNYQVDENGRQVKFLENKSMNIKRFSEGRFVRHY